MKDSEFTKKFFQHITCKKKIAILTHKYPDADGLSCAFIISKILDYKKIKADILLEKQPSFELPFEESSENSYFFYDSSCNYDTVIILDANSSERLGSCSSILPSVDTIFIIDHHGISSIIENSISYIDENATSTGILIHRLFYNIIKKWKSFNLTYYAKAIYTTIIYDTNSFFNNNITKECFEIPSELFRYNFEPSSIKQKLFPPKTEAEVNFYMKAYQNRMSFHDNRLIVIYINNSLFKENSKYISCLTDFFSSFLDCEILIILKQIMPKILKVSMRSKSVNVQKFAISMGGGGHLLAAGFETEKPFDIILKKIRAAFDHLL